MSKSKYEKISRELITALRGKRSQNAVSARMGFTYNQVSRWESGKRTILWKDFIDYSRACNVNVADALKSTFNFSGVIADQKKLLLHLGLKSDLKSFSVATGISRYRVSRWLSEKQTLKLDEMLFIMDFCTTELFRFLSLITNLELLPNLRDEAKQILREQDVDIQYPASALILSAIDLQEYQKKIKHDEAFVAQKTGLTIENVNATIAALVNAQGLILENGTLRSLRHQVPHLHSKEGPKKILNFLFKRHLDFVDSTYPSKKSTVGFKVFSLNSKHYSKIKERYIQFYNDVGKIINESQDGADKIYTMTVAIIDCEDLNEKS